MFLYHCRKKDKEHKFPRSIDDKDFDDFILKSYTTRELYFPSLQSRELADWYRHLELQAH